MRVDILPCLWNVKQQGIPHAVDSQQSENIFSMVDPRMRYKIEGPSSPGRDPAAGDHVNSLILLLHGGSRACRPLPFLVVAADLAHATLSDKQDRSKMR